MAINFSDLLGQTIGFEVYPSAVIGTRFTKAIVRGIVDHSGVTDFNPAVMHVNVFASLPQGSTDDFRKYNYLRLELENGNITFVGIPWINKSTIQVISNQDLVIKVKNFGSHENQEFIRRMLLNNGLTDFTITTQ